MLSYPVYAINKENMGYTFRLQKLMGNLKSEHLLKILKMSIPNKHMLVACSTEIFSQSIFSFIRNVHSHLWSVWDVFTSYEQCYQINDKKVVWYNAINIEIKMLFCSILWACVYDWFYIWRNVLLENYLTYLTIIIEAIAAAPWSRV